MPTVTNRIVDVNDVADRPFRRDWCALPERLIDLTNPAERVRLVDQELLRLFGRCLPSVS